MTVILDYQPDIVEESNVEVVFSNEPETRIFPCRSIIYDKRGNIKSKTEEFRLPIPYGEGFISPANEVLQKKRRKSPKFTIIEFKCAGCGRIFEKRKIDGKKDRCQKCQHERSKTVQKTWRERQGLQPRRL